MYFAFVSVLRRVSLVYIAMFLGGQPWLQMIIFVYISCMQLFYLSYELPYDSRATNRIEIMNESIILVCGYYSMCLIGLTAGPIGPSKNQWIGEFMNWTIRVMLLINGVYIIFCILKAVILSFQKSFKKYKTKWKKSTQF